MKSLTPKPFTIERGENRMFTIKTIREFVSPLGPPRGKFIGANKDNPT